MQFLRDSNMQVLTYLLQTKPFKTKVDTKRICKYSVFQSTMRKFILSNYINKPRADKKSVILNHNIPPGDLLSLLGK